MASIREKYMAQLSPEERASMPSVFNRIDTEKGQLDDDSNLPPIQPPQIHFASSDVMTPVVNEQRNLPEGPLSSDSDAYNEAQDPYDLGADELPPNVNDSDSYSQPDSHSNSGHSFD
ncbi:MAG: hypothetical protein V2I33_24740 [Kangiellaceae bacterium]|jgi:hypothetical protein|nr:hypothetical protein [Kangiellaceae bacterium]